MNLILTRNSWKRNLYISICSDSSQRFVLLQVKKNSRAQTAGLQFFYFYQYFVHFQTLPVSCLFWHWFNWKEIKIINNSAVSHQSLMENILNNAFWAFINHLRFVIKYWKWNHTPRLRVSNHRVNLLVLIIMNNLIHM